jgi:hypothetical protein
VRVGKDKHGTHSFFVCNRLVLEFSCCLWVVDVGRLHVICARGLVLLCPERGGFALAIHHSRRKLEPLMPKQLHSPKIRHPVRPLKFLDVIDENFALKVDPSREETLAADKKLLPGNL